MENEQLTDRLHALRLPQRLVQAVSEALPAALSSSTADLLFAAIQQWAPHWERAEPSPIPEPLAEGWQRDGGAPAELERIRAMFRYRRVRRGYAMMSADRATMRDSEQELRSFWITTGHDVADLDRYLAGVDAEFPDISPG